MFELPLALAVAALVGGGLLVLHAGPRMARVAASLPNLVQATLLGGVMALFLAPPVAVLGVHPGTLALVVAYGLGLRLVSQSSRAPMWRAVATSETREDEPAEPPRAGGDRTTLWAAFVGLAVLLAAGGLALAAAGESIVAATGLTGATVGVFLTGVASSLAELVVSIAAVRAGALTLAVANVIGGNTFDTMLVAAADVAYRDGSVYAAISDEHLFVAAITLVATAVLSLGLLRRERHGVGNIGFESAMVLGLYGVALLLVP